MMASAPVFLQHSDQSAAVLSRTNRRLSHCDELTGADRALVALGWELRKGGYSFTTITPLSHRRVIARPSKSTPTLQDIFGWSRPFGESDVTSEILRLMVEAQVLQRDGDRLRSAVRFSSLGGQLFAHSAFPTEQADAVFFGPDTYRFLRALRQMLALWQSRQPLRVLDVGAGSGAGGLHAATLLRNAGIVLCDINNSALRFSRINALINEVRDVEVVNSDVCENVSGTFDLIVSNPPYLVDPLARLYRHGGGALGFELSLKIAEQGLARLAPGRRLFLYTGSAIVDGMDAFCEVLHERLKGRARVAYEEIDPDVFGEELESPPYDRADRIAAVAATIEAL
jgi:methylase of polypeptide subunit release factors